MPELPEVESIAAGLRETIVGKRIAAVEVCSPVIIKGPQRRHWRKFLADLADQTITRVARRAKRLLITTNKGLTLLFQLGMTGKFLLRPRTRSISKIRTWWSISVTSWRPFWRLAAAPISFLPQRIARPR